MERNIDNYNTKQELYEYLIKCTENFNMKDLIKYTTNDISYKLCISRNLASQYLNEYFKKDVLVKINTRPVYYFDRNTLIYKFNLKKINKEFDDLDCFFRYIKENGYTLSNFKKAIGYNLSLKSTIEKCKVAVEYPTNGLPIHLIGEKGTGKSLLAFLTYSYAKENHFVNKSNFIQIDSYFYSKRKCENNSIISEISEIIRNCSKEDYLYIKDFDIFDDELQLDIIEVLNEIILNGKCRVILSSIKNLNNNYKLQQIIPLSVEIPSLTNRSILEKENLLANFLYDEQINTRRKILISEQAYKAFIQYTYQNNIEELKNSIKIAIANAFSNSKNDKEIIITILSLPKYIIKNTQIDFKARTFDENILSLDDIKLNYNYNKENTLYSKVIEHGIMFLNNKLSLEKFSNVCHGYIEEYNDYLFFKKNVLDEKMKIIEQTMLKIFGYIQDIYSINLSNSLVLVFSRWIYYSDQFNESIYNFDKYSERDVLEISNFIKEELLSNFTVAKDIIRLIKQNLDVEFSVFEHIIFTIMISVAGNTNCSLPIQSLIICHGYATASSIADVTNKMLKTHIFNAIDMPYDMPIGEIYKQIRKILYYNENRDILILVDLGSLEGILESLGDINNVNLGIINNVSTNLALEIGTSILNNDSISEILKKVEKKVVTSYKIIEKINRKDIIIFVSEIGSDIAEKVSEVFFNRIIKKINVDIRCYDLDSFLKFYNSKEKQHYNILFVASTIEININMNDISVISIEDIITFKSLEMIRNSLSTYLTNEEFDSFSKEMLNIFSLQNVVESLTILNANKVLRLVEAMLDDLQRLLNKKFSPKVIVGLNIHISCLIERLVKKEPIMTYKNPEFFMDKEEYFIDLVEKSFTDIVKQYNISLPISEIAYIYDYVNNSNDVYVGDEGDF